MSSKNKNNKFSNRAAKRFNDMSKVDVMSQDEIFEILDGDMKIMLDQVTAYRDHKPGASYPQYVASAFANLSTTLYFYDYVHDHVKVKKNGKVKTDLDDADLESLRMIISDVYRKSIIGVYHNQQQEDITRNRLLSKAFVVLCPRIYHLTRKFDGLSKSQCRDLTINFYGDPVYTFKFIHKRINESSISNKKKLKLLRKIYGKKRFVDAVGAAMTVEGNNSDCLFMLFKFMCKLKKKKRAKYIRAYAEAYKRVKVSKYFKIDQEFYDENKRIIKELGRIDIGYKKAFRDVKGRAKDKSPKPDKGSWSKK